MSLDQLRADKNICWITCVSSDICPWTLSVPRSSQFFCSGNCSHLGTNNAQGQIPEYIFQVKWRLLCLLSFKYFSQYTRVFENWGISLDFPPVLAGHIQVRYAFIPIVREQPYLMDYIQLFGPCFIISNLYWCNYFSHSRSSRRVSAGVRCLHGWHR